MTDELNDSDYESEQRKAEALDALIEILAKAAIEELLREQEGESGDLRTE